ncbi:ankyrin [Anaeromyces robustus]|uniref:Ankyrin n=1 Tax=Anaeromyces robustus TaxID=1754192 RepID=A0A1Y1XNW3_9FUNG|nr:ankyrin [Anaeromyces robustus]|eukprot:ORX87447.1 ankyrin [Anaeromyces robustus]
MSLDITERNNILKIINKNNISLLRKYVTENNISLISFNNENFDILIYSIEKKASIEIIKFIINQCKYETFNYYVTENDKDKVPLYSAIAKNNFIIADFLIKKNADINYFTPNIIIYLYNTFSLNPKNLNYILNNGFNKEYINEEIFLAMIEKKKASFLNIIFKHYIFNEDFILNLLKIYKNKEPLTKKQFNDLITNERNKLIITEEMYQHAVELNRNEIIKILFNNDSSEQDVIFCRINEYDILEKAVKINDYKFVNNVLKYEPFNFKSINAKSILLEVSQYNNLDIIKLFVESSLKATNNGYYKKIEKNSKSNNKYNIHYLSFMLNMLIKTRNLSFIKYFIEDTEFKSYININAKDINDEYPIITAFYTDDLNIFEYLIEKGADCNTKNCNGNSLISLSIDKNDGKEYIKKMLNENVKTIKEEFIFGSDSLMKAINNNNINIVILLVRYGLEHNINMNTIDRNGNTPLTLAYRLEYQVFSNF